MEALWGDDRPANAGGALSADLQDQGGGRDGLPPWVELILALPEPAYVDVEVAVSMLHAAESLSLWVAGDGPGRPP